MSLIAALALIWLMLMSGALLMIVSLGRSASWADRETDAAILRFMAEGGALRLAVSNDIPENATGAACLHCEVFIPSLLAGALCPACGNTTSELARIAPVASREDAAPARVRGARAV
jgi:hypothetical protein